MSKVRARCPKKASILVLQPLNLDLQHMDLQFILEYFLVYIVDAMGLGILMLFYLLDQVHERTQKAVAFALLFRTYFAFLVK